MRNLIPRSINVTALLLVKLTLVFVECGVFACIVTNVSMPRHNSSNFFMGILGLIMRTLLDFQRRHYVYIFKEYAKKQKWLKQAIRMVKR